MIPSDTSIADKYEQGPPQYPEVSDMAIPQANITTAEEAHAFLDEQLPLMRKQSEYDELMIRQLTNDALLNRRPIAQIPGLLGLELKVREINAQSELARYAAGLSDTIQLQKEQEAIQKSVSMKSGVGVSLQYTGDNAGQIQAFVQGKDINTAEPIALDPGNTEKRITITVADTTNKSGRRELAFLPTDWIIKCGDGVIWSVTNDEYQKITN